MVKNYLLITVLFLFASFSVMGQKTVKLPNGTQITIIKKGTICYASDHTYHGYNPAPENKIGGKSGNTDDAVFVVTYRGFPSDLQNAIDRALEILSGIIKSPVPIYVDANYEDLSMSSPGALAGAFFNVGATNLNFNNVPHFNVWYPIPLIEKLVGFEVTGSNEPDIDITVNSAANWFTDFNNPGNIVNGQWDLVTVILHEVFHGLGFAGFATVDEMTGLGRLTIASTSGSEFPFVFDYFLEDFSGNRVVNTLANDSNGAANFLQGGSAFFGGPSFASKPRLFVPSPWEAGSSLYHLNSATYNNTSDRLMTPGISNQDINHDPGLSSEILYDMGWDYTNLDHDPLSFLEDINQSYEATVAVITDSGIDTSSLELVYSQDTFTTTTTLPLIYDNNDQLFKATIPAPGTETSYQYYFKVTDIRGVTRSQPGDFGVNAWYRMTYGLDNTAPEIIHVPIDQLSTFDNAISITSRGDDVFAGIDSMFVEIKLNSDPSIEVLLEKTDDGFGEVFNKVVDFGRFLTEMDVVMYRLRAKDKSQAANEGFFPLDRSFITVPVSSLLDVADSYEASFDEGMTSDFFLNGFDVQLVNNFSDSCLTNTVHPYPTAGLDNTIDFTAELRVPIKINAIDPSIIFDEIVLVEPGEPNTSFGDTEFWDYVIVEGKKVGTTQWVPFLDGYDSKDQIQWESRYNGNISAGISNATPIQFQYKERNIDMTANTTFVDGDTVVVRFRLFSDPGAAGWGWAINNLKIQDMNSTVAVEEVENLAYFSIYPNPASQHGELLLDIGFKDFQKDINISVMDLNGKILKQWQPTIQGRSYSESIDLQGLSKGIYMLSVQDNKGITTRKVMIF